MVIFNSTSSAVSATSTSSFCQGKAPAGDRAAASPNPSALTQNSKALLQAEHPPEHWTPPAAASPNSNNWSISKETDPCEDTQRLGEHLGQVFFSVALFLLHKMSMHAPAEGKDPGYAALLLLRAFSKVQLGSKRPAVSLVVAFYILPLQTSPCPAPSLLPPFT